MLFGKSKQAPAPAPAKPKVEPYEIHVMPPKFHKYLAQKKGSGRLILILAIVLLVFGGITIAAYFFIDQIIPEPTVPAVNLNQELPANLNQNQNINANLNENGNANVNINENLNVNLNANENLNANANVNSNENVNANANLNVNAPPVALNYAGTVDADNDLLADTEEDLYGTEKRKPDTDEDGYLDGMELSNLFNPKAAGGALLANSGLINTYSNPIFNFVIFYPSSWLARPTDQSLREVIFQSATEEYTEILVEDNTLKLDLVQWYLQKSPETDLNQLSREITRQGYDALTSPDRLTYYLSDQNDSSKVYVITYNIGNRTKVNFLTTFKMMISSFKIISPPALPETNANANTNTNANINDNLPAP